MQVFVGTDSHYIHGYECRTDKEFARILEDEVRFHGAPNRILSDMAKAEISKKVEEILRRYMIDAHQSSLISNSRILLNVPFKISNDMQTMSLTTVVLLLKLGYSSSIMSCTS